MKYGKDQYTSEEMAKDLIQLLPILHSDTVLDAGSGLNKVWYNNLPGIRYECELADGCDFLLWDKQIDWIVGNPPFHIGWKFLEKSAQIAKKGIAFLGNYQFWNSLTPNRLQILSESGWTVSRVHIVCDKRWYGRYYFIIFTKENSTFLSWRKGSYQ